MLATYSAATGPLLVFAVCGCCLLHGDRPLSGDVVRCRVCGEWCSCEGCVAEAAQGPGTVE